MPAYVAFVKGFPVVAETYLRLEASEPRFQRVRDKVADLARVDGKSLTVLLTWPISHLREYACGLASWCQSNQCLVSLVSSPSSSTTTSSSFRVGVLCIIQVCPNVGATIAPHGAVTSGLCRRVGHHQGDDGSVGDLGRRIGVLG